MEVKRRSRPLKSSLGHIVSMAADSPQLKCPLENHSQVNAAEEQCYLIDIKRLIKEFHNPIATVIAEPIESKDGDNHASPVFM